MTTTLSYPPEFVPLPILAVAAVAGIQIFAQQSLPPSSLPVLSFPSGDEVRGADTALMYLARVSRLRGVYESDAISATQVDEWIKYAPTFSVGAEFEKAVAYANSSLELRTFLVGYDLSIADVVVWAALAVTGRRWESMRTSSKFPHLSRWYNSILLQNPKLKELVAPPRKVGLSAGDGRSSRSEKAAKADGSFDVELPGAREVPI